MQSTWSVNVNQAGLFQCKDTPVQKRENARIYPTLMMLPDGVEELSGCSSMTLTMVKFFDN
jgi:hypothetical protein